jgi:hypothetical protein
MRIFAIWLVGTVIGSVVGLSLDSAIAAFLVAGFVSYALYEATA